MKKSSIVLLIGLLSSCSPIYYAPNSQNVPMFTEQGQGEFGFGQGYAISLDETTFAQTFELQSAYSFFSHWAAQVNYLMVFASGSTHRYVEGAFGYFLPFNDNFVFEVYPGVGLGRTKRNFLDYNIGTYYGKA